MLKHSTHSCTRYTHTIKMHARTHAGRRRDKHDNGQGVRTRTRTRRTGENENTQRRRRRRRSCTHAQRWCSLFGSTGAGRPRLHCCRLLHCCCCRRCADANVAVYTVVVVQVAVLSRRRDDSLSLVRCRRRIGVDYQLSWTK